VTDPGSPPESQPESVFQPPQPGSNVARRWTVLASGLLLLALALVVIYTGPSAFSSPIALIVVAAIGLAALLLQVRFRRELPRVHSPLWLNILGILCAMVSLFADSFRLKRQSMNLIRRGDLLWDQRNADSAGIAAVAKDPIG
jgi:Flp pilus assembly protein TadB